jgi:exopolyphosphatase / guanosine-5'-triphosphate,3'-diphosphate pyrophosphatase
MHQPDARGVAALTEELVKPFAHLAISFNHSRHVARHADALFLGLRELHDLAASDLYTLHAAAILHDIGWVRGRTRHHKTSMEMVLDTPIGCLTDYERRRVACVARYHRRAFPDMEHPVYGALPRADRGVVRSLAALLRVADGLDRGQVGRVRETHVAAVDEERVTLCLIADTMCADEIYGARKKSDLFEEVYGRSLCVSRA